ncbi:MAG: ParB/RepB/Spo0J family partition protein [Bacteroidales bacterium]|nr:ParB/RepB/Spo0J family partition protein [Bacteroidales bacterium]
MATKQKIGGLGRGLGSILPDAADFEVGKPEKGDSISMVPVNKIVANPFQPRKEFDEEALEELAQSIRQQGVITPVTVRKMPDGTYQLIAGERRFRASQKAGLKELPAYIRVATDMQMMEMALVENIQRADLNAIEVAQAYRQLIEECRLTHEELSEKVGKNRSTITNYLRLLSLPEEVQQAIGNGRISMAHARVLAGLDDAERQLEILHAIVERNLSVHQTEQMAKSAKPEPKVQVRRRGDLPEAHTAAQKRLKERLQSTVEIKRSQRGKGTLTIAFNSDSDFERIMNLLEK